MDYVDRIIMALKKRGKTQRGLSLAIGKDPTSANKIIGRIRKMQDSEFAPAAGYLEISVNWLLTGEEKHKETSTKYSEIIAALIIDAAANDKNPSEEVRKQMQSWLNLSLTDDMRQGLNLDLERYKRLIKEMNTKKENEL